MKSKRVLNGYRLGFMVLVISMVLCLGVAVTSASDIGALVKEKCSVCHSTKRICKSIGIKDAAGWNKTIKRMLAKGAPLPSDQVGAAAGYLTGLAPGTGTVCQ